MQTKTDKTSLFVPDYEDVTWERARKSRHRHREALIEICRMKDMGFEMYKHLSQTRIGHILQQKLPSYNVQVVMTNYIPLPRPSSLYPEVWLKSPIEGATIGQIAELADVKYRSDTEEKYRQEYILKEILKMPADEIKTELMMYRLAA